MRSTVINLLKKEQGKQMRARATVLLVAAALLLLNSPRASAQVKPGGGRVLAACGEDTNLAITDFTGPMEAPYRPFYPGSEISVFVTVKNMRNDCVATGGFSVSMSIGTATLADQLLTAQLQPLATRIVEISAPALDPRKETGTFEVTVTPASFADTDMSDNSVQPWLWLTAHPHQLDAAFDMLLNHDQASADRYLAEAWRNNPSISVNPRYLVLRGWSKALSQDFPGANADFDSAISLNPACYLAYYHKAIAATYSNQHDQAQEPLEACRALAYADKLQFPHFNEAYAYEGACTSWLAAYGVPGYSHTTAQSLFLGAIHYGYRGDHINFLRGRDFGMANHGNYQACYDRHDDALELNEFLAHSYFYRARCSDGVHGSYNRDAQYDLYFFLCLAPEDTEAPLARALLNVYGWKPASIRPCLDPDFQANCRDTCSTAGYECGLHTICNVSTDCGSCGPGQTCTNGSCDASCDDTCTSLGHDCGWQNICGISTYCGACGLGETCSNGQCVVTCTDTCAGLGYDCGTHTICGESVSCGSCPTNYTCNNGQCIYSCTDTCGSLGFDCGTHTICGASTSCGSCSPGYTCSGGQCVCASSTDICGDDIDNNCDGVIDAGGTSHKLQSDYYGQVPYQSPAQPDPPVCLSNDRCLFGTGSSVPHGTVAGGEWICSWYNLDGRRQGVWYKCESTRANAGKIIEGLLCAQVSGAYSWVDPNSI